MTETIGCVCVSVADIERSLNCVCVCVCVYILQDEPPAVFVHRIIRRISGPIIQLVPQKIPFNRQICRANTTQTHTTDHHIQILPKHTKAGVLRKSSNKSPYIQNTPFFCVPATLNTILKVLQRAQYNRIKTTHVKADYVPGTETHIVVFQAQNLTIIEGKTEMNISHFIAAVLFHILCKHYLKPAQGQTCCFRINTGDERLVFSVTGPVLK